MYTNYTTNGKCQKIIHNEDRDILKRLIITRKLIKRNLIEVYEINFQTMNHINSVGYEIKTSLIVVNFIY